MPAFNEAQNLGIFVPQTLAILATLSPKIELIVVDDGSRDDTAQVMQRLCASHPEVVSIKLSRNFGKEPALTAGIDAAEGDVVILMDADGQHPASLLPEMLQKWMHGADVVYAVRKTRDDQSTLHASLTAVFYKLVNWGSKVKIPPNAGDFRLMDRAVVDALKSLPERNRFMKGLYAWVVMEFFIWGMAVPGYATIVVGMMFFSGIQLLSIGILAEYVGRIYEEVKQRPAYLISQRRGLGLVPVGDSDNVVSLKSIRQEASLL